MPDLTELLRLAEGATPGEWFYQEQSDVYTHIVRPAERPGMIIAHFPQSRSSQVELDARFTAAMSPDTAKKLIAVALAAQASVRAWDVLQKRPIGEFTGKEVPACDAADEALRKALEELR